jgi:predicted Zn-dependent peptidase
MQNALIEEKSYKIASFNGIEVYRVPAGKFKTCSVNFFFQDNLSRENATKNALLPAVLRRGSANHPTFRELMLKFEELYGTSFDCGVTKKGERQIIQFYLEYLSDRYLPAGSDQFGSAFGILYEVITNPALENGIFRQDYLEQEKENLKKLIEGRVNDKMQYSVEKCLEEMCRQEPYGIYDYGFVSDLKDIGAGDLYRHYVDMLETYPLQVYLAGDIDEGNAGKVIDILSRMKRRTIRKLQQGITRKETGEAANMTEKMSVTQGKLSLGFRTNTPPDSPDYYALMVCNGILGGGMHSKLFQNVREKASLAYYAFSRLDKFKGLMVVSSGIEIKNKDRALEIILQQLDEIRKGNISDYEFESTIKTIETGIKSLKDSQMQIVDFYLSQTVAGTSDSFDDVAEKVKKVTKQDIADVSGRIKLDMIYFLTASGPENQ